MHKSQSSIRMSHELGSGLILVIKVGTSSLLRTEQNSLNLSALAGLCETVRDLHFQGHHIIIVSSGAVGVGCQRLGLKSRPAALAQKQALAAVGQVHLMRYYDDFFSALGLKCAQVLLTQDNLATRAQYLNAAHTFLELLRYRTIPVVNENDTVAVEQLRFGDNDTLSAQVAALVHADWLFLMTDVPFLYTANPALDPEARPIYEVQDVSQLQVDTKSGGSQWGTGGMATKLTAARIATAAGSRMAICSAADPSNILQLLEGGQCGTVFQPLPHTIRGRKRWVLSVPVKGELWLDQGAVRAVRDKRKSLFSAGITKVVGDFAAHDAVRVCDPAGVELGRGLTNYSCQEVALLKGKSSKEIEDVLGYLGSEEVIHRDNVCLLAPRQAGGSSPLAPANGDAPLPASANGGAPELPFGNQMAARSNGDVDQQASSALAQPQHSGDAEVEAGGATYCSDPGVEERLRLLRLRQEIKEGDDAVDTSWVRRMAAAAALEAAVCDSAAAAALPQFSEDVDDAGWLPS